jgi:ABC-type molybdate transport system substrate-binding protein
MLRLLSTRAVQGALPALIPGFEQAAGMQVAIDFSPTNALLARIMEGDRADVAILTREGVDELAALGILDGGSAVDLVRSMVGLAVKAGAPKPDIGTAETLKAALLATGSIVYSRLGASGVYFAGLIERLGIADAVNAKATIIPLLALDRAGRLGRRLSARANLDQPEALADEEHILREQAAPAEVALVLPAPVGEAPIALPFVMGESGIDLAEPLDRNLEGLDHARRSAASVEHDVALADLTDRRSLGLMLRQGTAGGRLRSLQHGGQKLVRHRLGVAERELVQIAPGGRQRLIRVHTVYRTPYPRARNISARSTSTVRAMNTPAKTTSLRKWPPWDMRMSPVARPPTVPATTSATDHCGNRAAAA